MKYVACTNNLTATSKAARTAIDDVSMYFQLHEEGDPLLLLHPSGTYAEKLNALIPTLADQF